MLKLFSKIKKNTGKKYSTVLVLGQGTIRNRGCEAILSKTMDLLDRPPGSIRFMIPMFLYDNKYDGEYARKQAHQVKIFPVSQPTRCSASRDLSRKPPAAYGAYENDRIINNLAECYKEADFVIAVGGDNYTTLGLSMKKQLHIHMLKKAIDMGKITVVSAATIGPFPKEEEKWVADILNKVDLITVRERITLDYLSSINVTHNVKLVADPAYLLRAEEIDTSGYWDTDLSRTRIGVNISDEDITYSKRTSYETYLRVFMDFIENAIERYKATILLIPHITIDGSNDLKAHEFVYEKLKRNKHIRILRANLDAAQTKYVIGQSDYFVGSRMHSTVASLSSFVPTVAIAYSCKSAGIFKNHFGHDDFVIDIDNLDNNILFNKMDFLISNRNLIIERLKKTVADSIINSEKNGDYIRYVFRKVGH